MFNKIKSVSLSSHKVQLVIIISTYIILASTFGYDNRYQINPDGVSYLRLARHIAEGNFQQSVTGYWGPLISWCIAPFLFFGVDGLTSGRIVIALWGLGFVFGSWLLASRFGLSHRIKFIAILIAAFAISDWSERSIHPDILLSTLLVYYFYTVTDPDILKYKKIAFLCGVFGGFAYLAKHYAFPFFLFHYPLILLLRGYTTKDEIKLLLKKTLVPLVVGMVTFLTIASPWVITISSKYQHLTLGTSGKRAHSLLGPQDRRCPPSFSGLHKPKKAYVLHTWEDPSEMDYNTWSPFENKKYFIHQIKMSISNTVFIIKLLIKKFFIFGILSLLLLPISFLWNPLNPDKRFLYGWAIITIVIFCGGYILTFAKIERYFYHILIVVLLLSFHFLEELKSNIRVNNLETASNWIKYLLVFILIAISSAFTLQPAVHLLKSVRIMVTGNQINVKKKIVDKLNAIVPGPYATIGTDWEMRTGLMYYTKKQYLGSPNSSDLEGITKELKAADGNALIIFDNLTLVKKIKSDSRYSHKAVFKKGEVAGWDKEINVFILLEKQNQLNMAS